MVTTAPDHGYKLFPIRLIISFRFFFSVKMAEENVEYQHDKERDNKIASPGSVSDNEDIGAVSVSEKALLRKIDWRLLPAVGILYLLSFLDRSNVANARIEGLAADLGMSKCQDLPNFPPVSSCSHTQTSWQPIFDGIDAVLYWLRLVRGEYAGCHKLWVENR